MLLVGKILGGLILGVVLFVALSVPIAMNSDKKIGSPGVTINKIVFRHANILPMDSNYILYNQAVFVENDVISKICSDSLAAFAGYEVLELNGQFILPGLIDMHAHVFDRSDLTNYLASGVTHVRNMMGFPMHLRWKKEWKRGDFPGSEMTTASPTLNYGEVSDPFHKTLRPKEDPAAVVVQYYEAGYDFIKIYDGLTESQFSAIMNKAGDLKLDVAGHPPSDVSRNALLNSSLISFEHIEEVYNTYMGRKKNDSLAIAIAKEFKEAGKPVCVTLSAYHNIYMASNHKEEFLKQVPYNQINPLLVFIGNRMLDDYLNASDKLREAIAAKREYLDKLVRFFHSEGVTLVFGTDTGPNLTVPGYTVRQELMLLQKAGLPRFDILKSATIEAAKVMGKDKEYGTIEVGKRAEFIVVPENPLDDLSQIQPRGILANRLWYDSEAVRSLALMGKEKASSYVSMGNLIHQFFNK